MTMFRVGPAGIPASLKTDMNSVLNKKFGTTGQNYPPNGWPDDVNLMGPLPEKTASGSVASITDGADGVPVKNWGVTVDANLSGVSAVSCSQGGKNLVDNSAAAWEGGNINTSGGNATGAGYVRTIGYYDIGGGMSYEISGIATPSQASDFRLFFYDETQTFISYKNYGSTPRETPANARYMRIRNVVGADMSTLQIEYGTTATAYEPYTAPTVLTVNLGRTIYGGSVDVVNGTGTDENGNDFTFTPITPTPETALGTNNFWADTGDSTVVYRRDIDLALQAVSGTRNLLMTSIRPEVSLDNDPEQLERTENPTEQEGDINNER